MRPFKGRLSDVTGCGLGGFFCCATVYCADVSLARQAVGLFLLRLLCVAGPVGLLVVRWFPDEAGPDAP